MSAFQNNYLLHFESAISQLKLENRYRAFADLERDAVRFPYALWRPSGQGQAPREVTIWCSNDYLGMGGHDKVVSAATHAAQKHGAAPEAHATYPAPIIRSWNSKSSSPGYTARMRRWCLHPAGFPTLPASRRLLRFCRTASSFPMLSTIIP